MKQNFTDRLFWLFRRSKTICVRLRGCLPRSGASLPYRPGIRFVCIICMLPSYPCMCVRARRARQELERAMELFRTCRKPSHRVQSKHHRSAACVWGKMPRSDRNVGNFPAFCAALPVPVPAAAVICAWIPNIKGKDTVYVSLKNKFDNDFARKSIFKNMLI